MGPKVQTEIRAYAGALPVAATLLVLVISGLAAATATAHTSTLPRTQAHRLAPLGGHTLVLYPGAGYEAGGSRAVRVLQRLLVKAGFPSGPIDGRYGPLTERTVTRYQADRGLQVDGVAGPHTLAALSAHTVVLYPGAGSEAGGSRAVRVLQRLLAKAGYPPGRIDGRYGPLTGRAVRRYQRDRGLRVDGIAGSLMFADLRPRSHPAAARRPVNASPPSTVRRVPTSVRRVRHPTGLPSIGWLALLALLGLGLVACAVRYARRGSGDGFSGSQDALTFGEKSALVGGGEKSAAAGHAVGPRSPLEPHADAVGADRAVAKESADATGTPDLNGGHRPANGTFSDINGADRVREESKNGADRPGRKESKDGSGTDHLNGGRYPAHEASSANGTSSDINGDLSDIDRAFSLGVRLDEQGDLAGAEAAYRRADRRGHAAAASNLGVLLEGHGDAIGAEAAYRRADERGEANGTFNLGVLLEEQGDLAGAEAAYRRADQRGHAAATSNLGVLLEGQDDAIGAEAAYRRADERGEANAAYNLGVLLEEQGDLAGAERAYGRADERGGPKVTQMARAALLELRAGLEYSGAHRSASGPDGA
jgi:peptidoglycan hydrolase-like protein with peptidoglycan-binding domain